MMAEHLLMEIGARIGARMCPEDGNIFFVLSKVVRFLRNDGRDGEVAGAIQRVTSSGDYIDALSSLLDLIKNPAGAA